MHANLLQFCLTLCYPMDCRLADSCAHGFSRHEYWSGLPCPPQEDLFDTRIGLRSPEVQVDSLLSEPLEVYVP